MMRVGWLADKPDYKGGAELEAERLIACAPSGIEIIPCPPGRIVADVDVYVIHNCFDYDRTIIGTLSQKPVIKRIHDVWLAGNMDLRRWLLAHSKVLLFSSPLHLEVFKWQVSAPIRLIPSAIDTTSFEVLKPNGRTGACWIGRMVDGKGILEAAAWAKMEGLTLDLYGFPRINNLPAPIRYCGELPPEAVASTLAQYQTFVFLPEQPEPYARTAVEAWLAGCKLVINGNVGARWWIEKHPEQIPQAASLFWETVTRAVN